jgi:hypothetical protein
MTGSVWVSRQNLMFGEVSMSERILDIVGTEHSFPKDGKEGLNEVHHDMKNYYAEV